MGPTSWYFTRPSVVFITAILLRLALMIYGRWHDAHSPVKYTDVDYLVFTDAARFVSQGRSPYERATYRYTPLLAWLLYPTSWGGVWFEFGKGLFAAGDIVTGLLILRILRKHRGMDVERAMRYAGLWVLNPFVANISTRGSSEGLVAVIVIALLWSVLERRTRLAGCLLGLGVHVKIYPFIYAVSIFWWLGSKNTDDATSMTGGNGTDSPGQKIITFFNPSRRRLILLSFATFTLLNAAMYNLYGWPFIEHTFLYHLTRIDHRHNFSIYNTVLYLNSARGGDLSGIRVESLAFAPQMALSLLIIPLALAKMDLPGTMLAQTFAFVTFNKVCTSQYFLWYLAFLPFYLPRSSFLRNVRLGLVALVLWILGQAAWLQQAYGLEFLGKPTFMPGLWSTSILFFAINCWILGIIVQDLSAWQAPFPQATKNHPDVRPR